MQKITSMIKRFNKSIDKDKIAELLMVDKSLLEEFENEYQKLEAESKNTDNLFDVNSKMAAEAREGIDVSLVTDVDIEELTNRIIDELIAKSGIYEEYNKNGTDNHLNLILKHNITIDNPITNEEILQLPENLRPELTGSLLKTDIKELSYVALLSLYYKFLNETNKKKKISFYHLFRQGLDLLDIDSLTYDIIGTNQNSFGYWFPEIVEGVERTESKFFKIPETKVIKLPPTLLQLTRLDYASLTPTTIDIVNRYCKKIFDLDENKTYFIKTGTYSSKFDFRNAKVTGAKEVRELGEYLLFIHFQALQMASPLSSPCIYGVSTTNEWVVREYIEDKENNPCIYHGMPLHTEYRVFVDLDSREVLGITPYWRADVMKKNLGNSDEPDKMHDYIIYSMYEPILMKRYYQNKDRIVEEIEKVINNMDYSLTEGGLEGQWSIDVMQNTDDFWIIDMALAQNSALNDCIPANKLKIVKENWLPKL